MRLGRKNQVTCFFFTRLSLSLDKILSLGKKNKQVCFVLLSLNRIFARVLQKEQAPVVQWIEWKIPVLQIRVRFPTGVLLLFSFRH